jgi:Domain of unknown function (DUF1877)
MGIVCEYYIIENEIIDNLKSESENAQNWIDENYSSVNGKYHIENDIVFVIDKGWAVAKYLLKECDITSEKILNSIDGTEINKIEYDFPKFIYSEKVKEIYKMIETITEEKIRKVFNVEKMIENNVYNADFFDESNLDFLMLHIDTIKNAFRKATENENGIIINYH